MTEHNTSSEIDETDLGATLKSQREAKGYTLDDIYRATMIPVAKIELLEKNDYSFLDAPVFVSGYIRSYAKKLGADADALVALYQNELTQSSAIKPMLGESQEGELGSAGLGQFLLVMNQYKALVVAFSAAIVLLCVWLAIGNEPELSEGALNNVQLKGDASAPNADMEAPQGINAEQLEIERNEPTAPNPDSVLLESAQIVVEENISRAEDLDTLVKNEDDSSLNQIDSIPAVVNTVDSSSITDEGEALASAGVEQPVGSSQLDFSFSDDCWLEVKDGNGDVLIAQLKYKGDNLRLFGQAPFKIMLGNAQAAELQLDSKPVTLRPNGSAKTLKITLPAW